MRLFIVLFLAFFTFQTLMASGNGDDWGEIDEMLSQMLGATSGQAQSGRPLATDFAAALSLLDGQPSAARAYPHAASDDQPDYSWAGLVRFVRNYGTRMYEHTPWDELQKFDPQKKYGKDLVNSFYNNAWQCIKQFNAACINYFRAHDPLNASARNPMLALAMSHIGTEVAHGDIHRTLSRYFSVMQLPFQKLVESYCKTKEIPLQTDQPTCLGPLDSTGDITTYRYCYYDEHHKLIGIPVAHKRNQAITVNCAYSDQGNRYIILDENGTLVTESCLAVQLRQQTPLVFTLCAYYGKNEGRKSFNEYERNFHISEPREGDTQYKKMARMIMGDSNGRIGIMQLPETVEDTALVDLLLLEALQEEDIQGRGSISMPEQLLLPPPVSTEAASAAASTTDAPAGVLLLEQARAQYETLIRNKRKELEEAAQAALEAEWKERQQWVQAGAPRAKNRHHNKPRHHRGQQKRAAHLPDFSQDHLQRKIQARIDEKIGSGRVKYRLLIRLFKEAIHQIEPQHRQALVLNYQQHGSHTVVHAPAAASAATVVRPHGRQDNTMPAHKARSLVGSVLDVAFAKQKNSTSS